MGGRNIWNDWSMFFFSFRSECAKGKVSWCYIFVSRRLMDCRWLDGKTNAKLRQLYRLLFCWTLQPNYKKKVIKMYHQEGRLFVFTSVTVTLTLSSFLLPNENANYSVNQYYNDDNLPGVVQDRYSESHLQENFDVFDKRRNYFLV